MSLVRPRKESPKLDMNPMVDLAFLLVTFFMLTTTFKTEEPTTVETPESHSELKIPDTDLAVITVNREGEIFFSIQGKEERKKLLRLMSQRYGIGFSEEETEIFSLLSGFGLPLTELKSLLNIRPDLRNSYDQPGIPLDSLNNELRDWAVFARIANPRTRIAVKGDRLTPYPRIQEIIHLLVDNNINRFSLITELEQTLEEGS